MKRLAPMLLLVFSAFAVQAQSPAPAEPAQPAAQAEIAGEAQVAATSSAAGEAQAATPAAVAGDASVATPGEAAKPGLDPGCVRESGTRLKKRDKKGCTGAPGTSYSRADIDRTGAVDTADAVRKLSTSGTVRRGN